MLWKRLEELRSIHYNFAKYLLTRSQFDGTPVSALPSLTFLVCTFILFHRLLHRYSNPLTPLKIRFCRELGLQWSFFYIVRVWFVAIKSVKWLTKMAESYLEVWHQEEKFLWLQSIQVSAALFTMLTFIGMIPVTMVIMDVCWTHTIPNFLLWVGEDPWIRSEIGISGHYLDRPPNFQTPPRKEYAYRTRRSISNECISSRTIQKPLVRNCRSFDVLTNYY